MVNLHSLYVNKKIIFSDMYQILLMYKCLQSKKKADARVLKDRTPTVTAALRALILYDYRLVGSIQGFYLFSRKCRAV